MILAFAALFAPILITVHSDQIIRRDADRFFGIDLNYIRDRDSNRPHEMPLDTALSEMGVSWLRFPGGEKSNYHLWSEPPYLKPSPRSLGWYATPKGDRMNFDEFIQHARAVHAEPYVVVACIPGQLSGRTEAQQLETAVAWVRYSRLKGYAVRYWEIGNENWNGQKASAPETGRIVVSFSKAMKAADPSIQVGASGDNDRWWGQFLPIAAPDLDFLSVSEYTGWEWKGYERFLARPNLGGTAVGAVAAIDRYASAADRSRLRVIVAETNTKDYSSKGWPDSNDLGHALVTFATLGKLVSEPRVTAAMVWTTRWMNDSEAASTEFYALGSRNEVMPTGQAIEAWGRFVKPLLLSVDGNDAMLDAFASRTLDGRAMTVWLLNRGRTAQSVRLKIDGPRYGSAALDRFSGTSESDVAPRWQAGGRVSLDIRGFVDASAPPLSVSVFSLR